MIPFGSDLTLLLQQLIHRARHRNAQHADQPAIIRVQPHGAGAPVQQQDVGRPYQKPGRPIYTLLLRAFFQRQRSQQHRPGHHRPAQMRKLSHAGAKVAPSGGYRSQDNRCQKGVKDASQHADAQPGLFLTVPQLAGQEQPREQHRRHKQPELSCRLRIQQVSEHSLKCQQLHQSQDRIPQDVQSRIREILAHGAQSHKQQQSDAEYRQVILEAERKAFQAGLQHAGYPVG